MRYDVDNRQYPITTSNKDRTQRILQNCKNLLMTKMGEVPYGRSRGFDQTLLDLPMNQLKVNLCRELDRVLLFVPEAELVDAECSLDEDGTVYIRMTVEIEEEGDMYG